MAFYDVIDPVPLQLTCNRKKSRAFEFMSSDRIPSQHFNYFAFQFTDP